MVNKNHDVLEASEVCRCVWRLMRTFSDNRQIANLANLYFRNLLSHTVSTGHFGGSNVEQQLLPLILTACRGHSGVNKSPFRASHAVRGMPECSQHLRF